MKLRLLKNYFVEIWLLFVLAIALTISFLSLVLYRNFEASTIDTVNRLNRVSLAETARINEYVRKMIRTSGMELFSEPSVQRLMYGTDLTNFEAVTGVRRIDSVKSMGRFIHSIYVYNAATGYLYATSDVVSEHAVRFEDRGVVELLSSGEELRRLTPIARFAGSSTRLVPVHTFFFFSTSSVAPEPRGALVINVTVDWLDEIVAHDESELLVVDPAGMAIYGTDRGAFLRDLSGEPYIRRVLDSAEPGGVFVADADGRRRLVLFAGDEDLWFIRLFDYDALMAGLQSMRDATLYAVLAMLVVGIAVAFVLSRLLYRPIRRIVRTVDAWSESASTPEAATARETDELGHLSIAIESIVARNTSLEAAARSRGAVLQREVLKELLLGHVFGGADPSAVFGEYGIMFRADEPFRMVVARHRLPADAGAADPASDGVSECEPDECRGCAVDMSDVTVYLLQGATAPVERRLIRRLQSQGARLVVRGPDVPDARSLPAAYARAFELAQFAFLFQPGEVVSVDDRRHQTADFEYPTALEQRVLQSARSGEAQAALALVRQFFEEVSAFRHDHFRFAVRRLYVSLELLAHGGAADADVARLDELPVNPDTVDEICAPFARLLESLEQSVEAARAARRAEVAEAVRREVAGRYTDPNLSLRAIADQVGLSGSYLARLYKEETGTSVADAINDFRLEIAGQLLLSEDAPAREIAVRVGLVNENYFYTLFRKKVGMTPAAYRRAHREDAPAADAPAGQSLSNIRH